MDELAQKRAAGRRPTLGHASKFELQNKSWITPGALAKAGCHVSIITDSPVIPQKYLPICAGLAVKAGHGSVRRVPRHHHQPRRAHRHADRVGSLEVGKDADIAIADGCRLRLPRE